MTRRIAVAVAVSMLLAAGISAQQATGPALPGSERPDLSGTWSVALGVPTANALKRLESPPCREQDGPLLRNNDHHDQR